MSFKLNTVFISGLLVFIVSVFTACHQNGGVKDEETEIRTPVTVVPVTIKPVESATYVQAAAEFMHKGIVRTTTTGTIFKTFVNRGDHVSAGQMLFSVKTREAAAVSGKTALDTTLSFNGTINIYSQKEGIVSSVSYQKGDFVQEGDEMATISEQESLVFIMDVPFEVNQYIEKNRECIIRFPDNREIKGSITGTLSEMDVQSQTYRYIVTPSSTKDIPANLIVNVKLVKESKKTAVVLPKKAVLGNEALSEFWVMKLINDSTAVKVVIRKGFENNEEVEIEEPTFAESDRIVLNGNYGLPDTARISITRE